MSRPKVEPQLPEGLFKAQNGTRLRTFRDGRPVNKEGFYAFVIETHAPTLLAAIGRLDPMALEARKKDWADCVYGRTLALPRMERRLTCILSQKSKTRIEELANGLSGLGIVGLGSAADAMTCLFVTATGFDLGAATLDR